MKNNRQKNRNRKNQQSYQNQKSQQNRQKQQPQRRDLMALLANIDITEPMVSVPRDEYDELVYRSALVDFLHMLFKSGGKYATCDLLEKLFTEVDRKEDN